MNNIQFDTPDNEFGQPQREAAGFDLTGKLIAWGLVSSRKEAQYVLIAVAVLALVGAFILLRSGGAEPPPLLPQ